MGKTMISHQDIQRIAESMGWEQGLAVKWWWGKGILDPELMATQGRLTSAGAFEVMLSIIDEPKSPIGDAFWAGVGGMDDAKRVYGFLGVGLNNQCRYYGRASDDPHTAVALAKLELLSA